MIANSHTGVVGKNAARSRALGSYYARLPDGRKSLFVNGEDSKGTELEWMKVYGGVDCGLREIDASGTSIYR